MGFINHLITGGPHIVWEWWLADLTHCSRFVKWLRAAPSWPMSDRFLEPVRPLRTYSVCACADVYIYIYTNKYKQIITNNTHIHIIYVCARHIIYIYIYIYVCVIYIHTYTYNMRVCGYMRVCIIYNMCRWLRVCTYLQPITDGHVWSIYLGRAPTRCSICMHMYVFGMWVWPNHIQLT